MKYCVLSFSLFLTAIHCDLPLVSEITELTDLNTVIGTAVTLSKTHLLNATNSFVRHRQDFGIEFWNDLTNRGNTRSLEIRNAIGTDLKQVLTFYKSNQVLHDAAQRLADNLISNIAAITNAMAIKLEEATKIAIPAGDFIFNDVEQNHVRLSPIFKTLSRGCANDFENFFRSMTSAPSSCGKIAVVTGESLYFDWGFKLADIYQDFLDATNTETLNSLSDQEVLAIFNELDEETRNDLSNFNKHCFEYVQSTYNQYMSCMARIFISSRTSEKSIRKKLECLNLPAIGLGLGNILGNKLG